jgi:type VI secretion system protein ImpB
MAESFQQRRKRQRPTRVNIVYEVETGGAILKKELPFVMGVLADLSGDGVAGLPEIAEREFAEITPENFDKVLRGMKPRLEYAVDNKLEPGSQDKIGVSLEFESFADFTPERIAEQVGPLRELLEKRKDLSNLKAKLAANRNLGKALQAALTDEEKMNRLRSELTAEGGDSGES